MEQKERISGKVAVAQWIERFPAEEAVYRSSWKRSKKKALQLKTA
jgi:hypothetical protein